MAEASSPTSQANSHSDEFRDIGAGHPEESVRDQDKFLPIANISRIMKKGLPANAKIAKDAKEMVQECVSGFISLITSEASDKCQKEKRKTINGDDLLWAMGRLGFQDYGEPLKIYLMKYRQTEGEKVISTMSKPAESSSSSGKKDGGHHRMPAMFPVQMGQGNPHGSAMVGYMTTRVAMSPVQHMMTPHSSYQMMQLQHTLSMQQSKQHM